MDLFFKGLSVWAALISTVLGLIQLAKWWRTRVLVNVSIETLHQMDERLGKVRRIDGTFLRLEVINHLDYAISVTSISFVPRMGSEMLGSVFNVNHAASGIQWRLPTSIAPHSAGHFPMPWDNLRNSKSIRDAGAVVEVKTSTGETYRSRVVMPGEGQPATEAPALVDGTKG